jgi:hypothetical protein
MLSDGTPALVVTTLTVSPQRRPSDVDFKFHWEGINVPPFRANCLSDAPDQIIALGTNSL